MITPQTLKKGDTIAIVAFAKKIERNMISNAIKTFEDWGLKVVVGETVGAEWNQFAGNDELRKSELQKFINDPNIKAIISARGGYGSVRIIDQIDFSSFAANPKWIIGFSDITVFHSHIHQNFHTPTIHGTMPVFFNDNTPEALSSLKKVLFDGEIEYHQDSSHHLFCRDGEANGEIIGGNLSILYSLCGSNSAIDTNGKILFIEDLCEYMYHTDRMLQNLKRNGSFENLAGLIVGSFTDMKDGPVPFGKSIEELIFEYVKPFNYPVFTGFNAGHINNNNSLIFGTPSNLKVNASTIDLSTKLQYSNI